MSCKRPVSRVGLLLSLCFAFGWASAVEVDPALPDYRPRDGITGVVNSVCAGGMLNLMTYWLEGFQQLHPGAGIQLEMESGSTAPTALIGEASQIAPMTREMKPGEIAAFTHKWGYPPTVVKVAVDVLVVVVHPDNPLRSLTLTQLDSLFSSTRKRGGRPIAAWGGLGLGGEWAERPVRLNVRNNASGSSLFFRSAVMLAGAYQESALEHAGSTRVVLAVANDPAGIGYAGIGYLTPGVRALALADGDGQPVAPGHDVALVGRYPLARFFYLYLNRKPGAPPDVVSEFAKYALSKAGQQVVIKDGYIPFDAATAATQRAALE